MKYMKFKMIHENYNVSNLAASLAFYEEALGLKEIRRKTSDDFIIVYLKNENSPFELELTWLKDHPQKYDLGETEFHLAFEVDDYAVRVAVSLRAGRPSCSRRTRFSPWRRRISARRTSRSVDDVIFVFMGFP